MLRSLATYTHVEKWSGWNCFRMDQTVRLLYTIDWVELVSKMAWTEAKKKGQNRNEMYVTHSGKQGWCRSGAWTILYSVRPSLKVRGESSHHTFTIYSCFYTFTLCTSQRLFSFHLSNSETWYLDHFYFPCLDACNSATCLLACLLKVPCQPITS